MAKRTARRAIAMIVLVLIGATCSSATGPGAITTTTAGAPADAAATRLRVEVLGRRAHDSLAFTQGLVFAGGKLYESTGLNGKSSLREVDPQSGAVLRRVELGAEYFGEGLAAVGDRLIWLTWREKTAFVYRQSDLAPAGRFTYDTEGWGLCHDGTRLIMSDGTSKLYLRNPDTFAILTTLGVTIDGKPVERLNELECAGGAVYANVWQTDKIVRIDPATGRVTAEIDASGLLRADERAGADVLNGIAYNPASGTFLITGKNWPAMFEVRFVPA